MGSEDGAADLSKADIALLAALEPEVRDALIAVQCAAAMANEAIELAAQRNPAARSRGLRNELALDVLSRAA